MALYHGELREEMLSDSIFSAKQTTQCQSCQSISISKKSNLKQLEFEKMKINHVDIQNKNNKLRV